MIPSTRLALCATLLALACPSWAEPPKTSGEDLAIDPSTITEPWKGDLDGMVQRRMIRVLVVPNRMSYFTDKGTQRGIEFDAFRLVEQELNAQLEKQGKLKGKHLKVRFFFVPVHRDQLLPALIRGKGDIAAANLTVTADRQKLVDFASPVMTGVKEVLLTGPTSPPIASMNDLSGKEVFVRKSSSYYRSIETLNARFRAAGKAPLLVREAPEQLEDDDLIEMLNAGLVSALVVDRHKAESWVKVFTRVKMREDIVLRDGGDIAWAMRKRSPQLKAFLDKVAQEATSGKLARQREAILAQYLKSLKYVKDAASDAERAKFLALMAHFRKYGDKYDIDWLLMAAQGYQESTLDQRATSRSGAIGVMQVMPPTGKAMNVGDIRQTEPNIHAGVKYMRSVVDQYYGKEPMSDLDKLLFGFASYNAGPTRINQLRKEAQRRQLDPNVWFGNVEHVAAERIGHETVTYVSNIYKYYVAYRLIHESERERERAMRSFRP
jgi:membrane-bound lytic murein transglycosylase MltF